MIDIENVILFQIEKTNKLARMYSQREFDRLKIGITVEQWILLKIIHETSPISQKELSQQSLRDPASITRTLDILQKKGMIIREAIPENRRQYNIILTPDGETFVKTHLPIVKQHRQKSTEGFTEEEINTLYSFLKRMQSNFE